MPALPVARVPRHSVVAQMQTSTIFRGVPGMIKLRTLAVTLAALTAAATSPAYAQKMPDIGFESVGRGKPLAADVREQPVVGPNWVRGFVPGQPFQPPAPGQAPPQQELNGF